MSFTSIIVTGNWFEADGTTPARGRVTFQLSTALIDATDNTMRAVYREVAVLSGGSISKTLVANDDTTTLPVGSTYHVREELVGTAVRAYDVVIPHSAPGGTIDLADLVPSAGIVIIGHITEDILTEFPIEYYRISGESDDSVLARLLLLLTEDADLPYATDAGGTIVFKGGKTYTLLQSHIVPSHVNIRGGGETDATIVIGADNAGFVFQDPDAVSPQISTGQYGGMSGNLSVNGNGKLGCPWIVGKGNGRSFSYLQVYGGGGDGVRLYGAQNPLLHNCRLANNAGYNLRFDYGTAGVLVAGGNIYGGGLANLGSTAQGGYQHTPPIVPETTEQGQITFVKTIFDPPAATAGVALDIMAGNRISFISCPISSGTPSVDTTIVRVTHPNPDLATSHIEFLDCSFIGRTYTGTAPSTVKVTVFDVDGGADVILGGTTRMAAGYLAFAVGDTSNINVIGDLLGIDAIGTYAPATIATTQQGDATHNEIQTVTLTGTPVGGVLTLTHRGETTAPISATANAATIQAALEALTKIGAGNVAVTGGPWPALVSIQYQGALALTSLPEITTLTPNRFSNKGGTALEQQQIRGHHYYGLLLEAFTSTDPLLMIRWAAQLFNIFDIRADGILRWSDGKSNPDTTLYRRAADQLRTDDKFLANLGIGVGNSAAGTVLGSVVKKVQIFDASGVSLGYIPVYDTIT